MIPETEQPEEERQKSAEVLNGDRFLTQTQKKKKKTEYDNVQQTELGLITASTRVSVKEKR